MEIDKIALNAKKLNRVTDDLYKSVGRLIEIRLLRAGVDSEEVPGLSCLIIHRSLSTWVPDKGTFANHAYFRSTIGIKEWYSKYSNAISIPLNKNVADTIDISSTDSADNYELVDDNDDEYRAEVKELIDNTLLSDRDKTIITMRLDGFRYREISDKIGLSMERVRQIENDVIKKIRNII